MPGIPKIVRQLLNQGLLAATPDRNDRRRRHLSLIAKGLKKCRRDTAALLPAVSETHAV